ncbi:hypothetical protein [Pseudomonas sp. NA-150]|uniref:hypothetical protein n=1 Tax=Pseudomonas sp. NA-150 TaxID=3367525 RepID=UPI0037C6BCEC
MTLIECLETALGTKAQRNFLPMQEGDVVKTWADISSLSEWIGVSPHVSVEDGVRAFVSGYLDVYQA